MATEDKKAPQAEPGQQAVPAGAEGAAEEKQQKTRKAKGDEAKLAALETRLGEAEQKNAELQDQLLRTIAEYDNYRKRSQKEHDAAFNSGVCHAVTQLLPILDTLEVAAQADTKDEEYKKGVMMILAKSQEVFNKLGICEIEAIGQPFNPELHNAVMQDACEGAECGSVTKVMQKGYKMGDRVIRHAAVAVKP